MNKKAIAILGAIFILIVGTLGFLVYAKYAGNKTPAPAAQPQSVATTTPLTQNSASTTPVAVATPSPTPSSSDIFNLTTDQVVSPALFFNGEGISYFDAEGDLFQTTLQNNNGQLSLTDKKQLDIPQKPGITKILWPAKGNDFIAQITGATGVTTWSYFNSNTGAYTDLPPQVESVDWMPSGTQIMYVWLDSGKATLNISNPDTTGWKDLADMWETDDSIHISPDGSQLLYYEANSVASTTNVINSVTADGKVWKTLVQNGENSGVLWSPDGQKFLFGKLDPTSQQYQLWVYNLTTGENENLGLFTTPDKAAWASDSNTVYAAVPDSAAQGQNSLTVDSFYKMDITTLNKTQYPSSSSTPVDGQNLFLDSTGSNLFFKNAQDGGLYYLNLNNAADQNQ